MKTPAEMSIEELRAAIATLQDELFRRVCGDPSEYVTISLEEKKVLNAALLRSCKTAAKGKLL